MPMIASLLIVFSGAPAPEAVGERPYELEWANRTEDAVPPLVDFEDLSGWKTVSRDAEARIERTREQQIWGRHVAKLTYRGTGPRPEVRVLPPEPVPAPGPFDAVTVWIYGNNWGWAPDPATPPVGITAIFEDREGREFGVYLYHVDWTEWNLLHRRLEPPQVERARAGARFKGLLITGGGNRDDRTIYIDNLAVFVEGFPPLSFEPRPERGIAMFPGQGSGANTGPGKLPFPTRAETILPENLAARSEDQARAEGSGFTFSYEGDDGKLAYRVEPRTGTLSDITARWQGRGGEVRPCAGGGVLLAAGGKAVPPEKAEPLGSRLEGGALTSRWRLAAAGTTAEVAFTFRILGKSLVVDVAAPGGGVAEVRYGRAEGLEAPRLVTNPFYLYGWGGARPAVAVSGPPEAPLFLAGNTDWCLSNASTLWAENGVDSAGAVYNGGTRYIPRTDGARNGCFERLFITLSPRYEEVLPTIPNPKSPWMRVAGTHLWRAHGAGDRKADAAFWTECRRHGMTEVIITDHETGWRDGGESFTFRTRAAPKKGGDPGQHDYARLIQDRLGFVYGPYNNFTDFAPVNGFWSLDLVSRTPENQLQHAWMRCYAPKPSRAVEFCARLAPEIQRKFRFSTAYCDVHTAVAPWDRTDYDARVPGAGTFAAVFYSFGEIMLLQKAAWDGPVYSEGTYHYLYAGLTDGNYGQDNPYKPWKNPWLVDFDLRKLHDLCCDFGMGAPSMFYGSDAGFGKGGEEMDAAVDRFLAATVAFGHPGFLTYEGGIRNALRSYYMLQALASRYTLARAVEIRYAGGRGGLLDTSAAVAGGAFERSQVVTRYSDGTVTAVNGSPRERMIVEAYGRRLDLPPNGYAGWTADGAVEVLSADREGRRADLAAAPAYIYADGRGRFQRFEKAASSGPAVCRDLGGGRHEVIPFGGDECGFAVAAGKAVALDREGKEIGPAPVRSSRGLTYVSPVKGAFSYLLEPAPGAAAATPELRCVRDRVVAGETVSVSGLSAHEVAIPADAAPGQRIWKQLEGAWIDFTVVPLADLDASVDGDALSVRVVSHLGSAASFRLRALGLEATGSIAPETPSELRIDLGAPEREDEEALSIEVEANGPSRRIERGLRTTLGHPEAARVPDRWKAGLRFRGGEETGDFGQTGAHVHATRTSCGGVERDSIAMHPPYRGGVGCSFALLDPVRLPAAPATAFRAEVGKGDGSDPGDGILYRVIIVDEGGREAVAAERTVRRHEWLPIEADLSPWAGRSVRIQLVADVGPADDSGGDWAAWATLRIESREPRLTRTLVEDSRPFRREPGPFPVPGLGAETLAAAKRGWLHYDGKGLSGTGDAWGSFVDLNGVPLGNLAPASGDEALGAFQEDVKVALTADALRTLGRRNVISVRNPKVDHFSIRRFWIELELADGRRCSSDVAAATWTQPPGWKHAEGILVPEKEEIGVTVWFQ